MKNLELTNLNCPFCKKRISNWCRKAKSVDALIDQKLWATIQKDFETEVQARLAGEASTLFVEGGFTHDFTFEDGAIGKEFQDQIDQIQAEENRRRDKELAESRKLIESIQLEERLGQANPTNNVENRNEREEQNGHKPHEPINETINDNENRDEFEATAELIELQRQLEARIEQQKKDEEFARQLQEEFRENSITSSPGVSTRRRSSSSRSTASKNSPNASKQTKGPRQMTLDGFFGRKRKREED